MKSDNYFQKASIIVDNFIASYGNAMPWLTLMELTLQDPRWHGEGSVLTHTKMVVAEFLKLCDQRKFSQIDHDVLLLACILHDIGKVVTTKEVYIDGVKYLGSPRHATVGASYLEYHFPEEYLDIQVQVVALVSGHHDIRRLISQDSSAFDFYYLTQYVSGEMFYLLEVCDIQGRISEGTEKFLDDLEQFKLFCQEYECFNQDRDFTSMFFGMLDFESQFIENNADYSAKGLTYQSIKARYDIANNIVISPIVAMTKHYTTPEKYPIVVIPVGLSGSGKTHRCQQFAKKYGFRILSPDLVREKNTKSDRQSAFKQCMEELKIACRNGEHIIFDATNIRKDARNKIHKIVNEYNGLTCIFSIDTSIRQCIINDRKRSYDDFVGEEVIKKQALSFQEVSLKNYHLYSLQELKHLLKK